MSILKRVFGSNKSASLAKERLKIVISHERNNKGLDFIPKLRQDIMQVLKKYIENVAEDQVDVKLDQKEWQSTLELNVTFPSSS